MTRPALRIGDVVRCSYLWVDDHLADAVGGKDRPCLVARVAEASDRRNPWLLLLPITHSPPTSGKAAIEIPARAASRAGLDDQRSWLILDEGNVVRAWDPEISPVRPGAWTFGSLPERAVSNALVKTNELMIAGDFRFVDLGQVERNQGMMP